jgi:hypothetical protein
VKGKYRGAVLEFLPSRVTTWKDWRTTYPLTKVLVGAKARGFMGSFRAKKTPNQYGLSVGSGLDVKLYPFPKLMESPALVDTLHGRKILVTFDLDRATAAAFALPESKTPWSFKFQGEDAAGRLVIVDEETKSKWSAFTGRCFEGKRKGMQLEAIPATSWLMARWRGFFPEGDIYR